MLLISAQGKSRVVLEDKMIEIPPDIAKQGIIPACSWALAQPKNDWIPANVPDYYL